MSDIQEKSDNYLELIGLCKGLLADGMVSKEEAAFLLSWFQDHPQAAESWPGKQMASRLAEMWADNEVEAAELDELKALMSELIGLRKNLGAELKPHDQFLPPLDHPAPEVTFMGKSFCFAGRMVISSRKRCEDIILEMGGQVRAEPTADLDYLVIGLLDSLDWKKSTEGYKILKAMDYRGQGHLIKIITEEWWTKALTEPSGPTR